MRIDNILIKPVVTEKTSTLVMNNVYTFEVNTKATKDQITEVVQKLYGATVGSVKTITRKGKVKRSGRRFVYKKQPDKKIAYITLTKGSISVFPKV